MNRIRKPYLVLMAAISVAILAFAIYFIMGISHVTRSILPGAHNSPSTSSEPYSITLRTTDRWGQQQDRETIHNWRLSLPRSFVSAEFGSASDPSKRYAVNLKAVVDPATLELSPSVLVSNKDVLDRGIIIKLVNNGHKSIFYKMNRCLKWDEVQRLYDEKFSSAFECKEHHVKCRLETHYIGWSVRVSVPKSMYNNLQKSQEYCDAVLAFLKNKTVSIDSLID